MVGALLGTQVNRDISIVNSFEILLKSSESATRGEGSGDVDMSDTALTQANAGKYALDLEFYETRKEQCEFAYFHLSRPTFCLRSTTLYINRYPTCQLIIVKAVFPTQEVVGWYTISTEPSAEDINIQQQVSLLSDHPSGKNEHWLHRYTAYS